MISEQMNLSGGWSNLLVRFRWVLDIPTSIFFIIIGPRSTKCQVAFLACKWKGYCNLVSKLSIQWLTINSLIGCPMSIEISYFCSWWNVTVTAAVVSSLVWCARIRLEFDTARSDVTIYTNRCYFLLIIIHLYKVCYPLV